MDANVKLARWIEAIFFIFLAYYPSLSFYSATSWYIRNNDRLLFGMGLYFLSLIWVIPLNMRVKDLESPFD